MGILSSVGSCRGLDPLSMDCLRVLSSPVSTLAKFTPVTKTFNERIKMFNWNNEFSGIEQTLDFVDGVMETIDNDVEFFEQSVIDIMEG
jgi:hypothetical protein